MSGLLRAGLAALVAMIVIDLPMITLVLKAGFEAAVPHLMAKEFDLTAALAFYVMYPLLVVWLGVRPAASLRAAAGNGALLGLFAYGTYELTNKATLEGWSWGLVVKDMAWGMVLTAIVATIAFVAMHRGTRPTR